MGVRDVNGDGLIDIVTSNGTDGGISVLIGNGNGTFQARRTYQVGINANQMELSDVTGDGIADALVTGPSEAIYLLVGNSNGSFRAATTVPGFVGTGEFQNFDLNNDGKLDILIANQIPTGTYQVMLGNGNGTFQGPRTFTTGNGTNASLNTRVADINGDGAVDILGASQSDSSLNILIGNGDGSFRAYTQLTAGSGARSLDVQDINGDGNLDAIVGESGAGAGVSYFAGNGDGTFKARVSYLNVTSNFRTINAVDMNGDGARDLVIGTIGAGIRVILGNADKNAHLQYFSISTQEKALETLDMTKSTLANIAASIGRAGASESRLSTTLANLQQTRENTMAAASRIQDADVAEESANLVRQNILQQASAAVLSQANQLPSLVIQLLKNS